MHKNHEVLDTEQMLLLAMLKTAIHAKLPPPGLLFPEGIEQAYERAVREGLPGGLLAGADWERLAGIADKHSVLSLIYELLPHIPQVPEQIVSAAAERARQTVLQNYRLLHLSSHILQILEEDNIKAVLLKGWQTANLYPVPEARKSGDIDILVPDPKAFGKAVGLLESRGFMRRGLQSANHHIELVSDMGIDIEVHSSLTEPFDSKYVNDCLEEIKSEYNSNIQHKTILGYPVACAGEAYDAFYLLLHMLQHFLRAGFGIKLLSDWAVFWSREIDEGDKQRFLELVEQSRILGFAQTVTGACVQYLGVCEKNVAFMMEQDQAAGAEERSRLEQYECFMKDIFEAEEFGRSHSERMVMLRSTGLKEYIREFHHQMRLNHPKASKCILLWPYLWIYTLVVFLINNKKVRKTTLRKVLKNAGTRSRLAEEMKLFVK